MNDHAPEAIVADAPPETDVITTTERDAEGEWIVDEHPTGVRVRQLVAPSPAWIAARDATIAAERAPAEPIEDRLAVVEAKLGITKG